MGICLDTGKSVPRWAPLFIITFILIKIEQEQKKKIKEKNSIAEIDL